ncbi:MAG: type II toxin-antitoxin system Phd/YefM family antitoxin [Candidatus Eremiobacteraeota bacterium]|nr:type II toxin-antitoxin system Phd/YefM family antitoxin [Candidatus Eremiobacteraeota bacterium]
MKISKDIKPITYLKSRASDLSRQINETHRPVLITQNGELRAVFQDPESYENMCNAIGLLKLICQGEDDVAKGRFTPQDEVIAAIEKTMNPGDRCRRSPPRLPFHRPGKECLPRGSRR